jgi:hypothetical protein
LPRVIRDDYLMRMVNQLAAALARIAGLRRAALLEQAAEEMDAAVASLGGIDPRLAEGSDGPLLAALVTDPARREALARLLEEQAEILLARGETARARTTREKARALAPSGRG